MWQDGGVQDFYVQVFNLKMDLYVLFNMDNIFLKFSYTVFFY